ncbi:hypothetical protein BDW02DRAFT_170538 [Decorospora gaudefroyi]|uniref:Uncharacterized protein n=1 Tax=Decorospora gaudefroyi TaxID=184978 RepID=A0A6A5JX35_9PLEO|nr:hypothetical protein BDW02DRAFT_170538 [Decorospora gaudefroyi]
MFTKPKTANKRAGYLKLRPMVGEAATCNLSTTRKQAEGWRVKEGMSITFLILIGCLPIGLSSRDPPPPSNRRRGTAGV